ncbi:hypothetical protein [Ichthyobacterium seriolicida]|uniref:DUF1735 domain-containing protein n=1 Tax=Ichthyobacterium seriolicida TaxID=242600 RepID=A0A1J1DWA8_9FLAO|nr:hypothetical protein [Ichthyobacterium seriolicida]BAV94151.1 hypothetical protein JBKA6_0138 [Ichthyobacterium seriolicida]
MKTKNLFKNFLSLLTLVLFAFSCTKPAEDSKPGEEAKTDVEVKPLQLEITSIKFEKAGNLKGTDVSEFYEKLFITRTPARNKLASVDSTATTNGYPTEFVTEATDIKGNDIFIKLPYNSNFEKLTANATVKAILTFKSVVDSVVLETPKTNIKGNSAEISFEINKDHFTSEKLNSANPVFKQVLKFSKAGFTDRVYTMNFRFSDTKSDLCTIGENKFGFKATDSGINAKGSFNSKQANDVVKAHYDTANSGAGKGETSSSPIEFKLRKGSSNNELKDAGVGEDAYFKADALELPDGAFIVLENDTDVNPITGMKKTGATNTTDQTDLKGASSGSTTVSYNFTVVAQNGTSKKYYKLTINAS